MNLDKIKSDIEKVLEKHKLNSKISTKDMSSLLCINIVITKESTEIDNIEEDTRLSKSFGFSQNIIGKEFIGSRQKRYRIVQIKTRNPRYPIIAMDLSTERLYKFPVANIKEKINNAMLNRIENLKNLLNE